MLISEGRRRLAEACETLAARQQRIKAAVRARIREIDHQVTIDKIRADSAAAVEQIKASQATVRRAEERLSIAVLHAQLSSARIRDEVPFALLEKWHTLHLELTGSAPADELAHLPLWQREIVRLARELQIHVSFAALPGVNAYAWATRKEIEIAPITSSHGYATALHECGHAAWPCDASHRRVAMGASSGKTCCVRCEVRAWEWAIAQAQPTWTKGMHRNLRQALSSYRRYGTVAEQTAIDDLVSDLGFFRAQLTRLT
jgi:hypothetical protein